MPSIDLQLNLDHTLPLSSLISEATENLSLLQHHWNGAKLTRCSAIFFHRCMVCVAGLAKLEKQQENRPCIFSRSSSATLGDPMWYFVVQISMTYCGRYSSLSADISLAVLADVWSVECLEATEVFTSRRAPPSHSVTSHRHTPKLQNGEYMSQTNWVLPWRREHQAPPGGIVVTELQPRLRRYNESEVKTQNRQWL